MARGSGTIFSRTARPGASLPNIHQPARYRKRLTVNRLSDAMLSLLARDVTISTGDPTHYTASIEAVAIACTGIAHPHSV